MFFPMIIFAKRQLHYYDEHFLELCQDSCFGHIPTNPSHVRIDCNGDENTLQDCGRGTNAGCDRAAGVYCGKWDIFS